MKLEELKLTPTEISNLIDEAIEKYEDVDMTDQEWEDKKLSIIAQAQLQKIFNHPDLYMIDKTTFWAIKSILKGLVLQQKSDETITWKTPVMGIMQNWDSTVIPLADLKEAHDETTEL